MRALLSGEESPVTGESAPADSFKEFLGTYNKLTENCFLDCIKDFTSREVKPEELPIKAILGNFGSHDYVAPYG
ncbi:mitochondrial import inner membrane translocase subunit tim9 [Limosa lapponica baueri]|uniref:Mitochondrial import inner membrane translocase subunit n=1 Tax=Limosa lapponica baueri TaxID=1758121 RepID=A0A2I0UFF1_LIMLA|nr:mitochondrial import inner membrane translocase subunit tim9 [Limosa lapponica baueri]